MAKERRTIPPAICFREDDSPLRPCCPDPGNPPYHDSGVGGDGPGGVGQPGPNENDGGDSGEGDTGGPGPGGNAPLPDNPPPAFYRQSRDCSGALTGPWMAAETAAATPNFMLSSGHCYQFNLNDPLYAGPGGALAGSVTAVTGCGDLRCLYRQARTCAGTASGLWMRADQAQLVAAFLYQDVCYYFDGNDAAVFRGAVSGTILTPASVETLTDCQDSRCLYQQANTCGGAPSGLWMSVEDLVPSFKYGNNCYSFPGGGISVYREDVTGTILTAGQVVSVANCDVEACQAPVPESCPLDGTYREYQMVGYENGDIQPCEGCIANFGLCTYWQGRWGGNGCAFRPLGNCIGFGIVGLDYGNGELLLITSEPRHWRLEIRCFGQQLLWGGAKYYGNDPAGTYTRTGGCAAEPISSFQLVAV